MSLDVFQQVFFLSLASNLVNFERGTQTSLQQALQKILQNEVLPILPEWQLVWGPVVWKNQPDDADTGTDNSWYIAFHPALTFEDGSVHPTYVVAIAGTPAASSYVWTDQNFAVNAVADFNLWVAGGIQNPPPVVPARDIVPGTPYIAKGTVDGLHILLTNAAPQGAASAGITLLDFLSVLDLSDDTRIITTGHSLGGALSPSLALALVSSGVIPVSSTLTYPSAGPSPGNRGFTELFTAAFPAHKQDNAKSYQGWNLNLVNTLDIVPQALYSPQYFAGDPPPEVPDSLEKFLEVWLPQHQDVYFDEVGVTIPEPNKSDVLRGGLTEKTKDEIRFNYPVIAGFEWAREHPKEAEKEIKRVEGN